MEEQKKFSIPKTLLLGFGFLGVSAIWSLYNSYVPVFLKSTFELKSTVIGFIMTIDNVFAVILLPFLGALSDRTRTRIGKRKPFIIAGAPIAAILVMLIPYFNNNLNLLLMMTVIIFMNLAMSLFRSPVIALMPDITPSRFRSQANGIINLMGGLGALLVYFAGKPLYDAGNFYPFIAGGLLMLSSCALVVIFVRENTAYEESPDDKKISLVNSMKELVSNVKNVFSGEKSLLLILLSVFCWFVGFNSIETFFTSYAKYHLGFSESTGTLILGFFSLSFMITAVISGIIGSAIGRKKSIFLGLIVMALIIISSLFVRNFYLLAAVFVLGGFGWSLINVNSLPMVLDMNNTEKAGGYTGLYYLFSQSASIVAPPLSGLCIDLYGYESLMIFSSALFVAAIVIVLNVKRGEAVEQV